MSVNERATQGGIGIDTPLCAPCVFKKDCKLPCAAAIWIATEYKKLRDEERRELIQAMRELMGARDAEYAPDIELLAGSVIASISELRFIDEMGISIGYIRSYERKIKNGKATLGDCRKVTTNQGAFLMFDFLVTIYDANVSGMTDNQIKILLWHELKHIKMGDRGLTVAPHDVEEFDAIIESCGLHWDGMDAGDLPDICGGMLNG